MTCDSFEFILTIHTNVSGDFTSSVLFFMLKEPSIGGQCHAYCPGMYSLYEGW